MFKVGKMYPLKEGRACMYLLELEEKPYHLVFDYSINDTLMVDTEEFEEKYITQE